MDDLYESPKEEAPRIPNIEAEEDGESSGEEDGPDWTKLPLVSTWRLCASESYSNILFIAKGRRRVSCDLLFLDGERKNSNLLLVARQACKNIRSIGLAAPWSTLLRVCEGYQGLTFLPNLLTILMRSREL